MANDEVIESAAGANGAELLPNTSLNTHVPPADWLLPTAWYNWAVAYEIKL